MNKIINGVNHLSAPLAGKKVSEVRALLAQVLNIDSAAVAQIDGGAADEKVIIGEGQTIEFIKASGTKG